MVSVDPSSPSFFEQKYRSNTDPWNFSGSNYEQEKYSATVAALAHRRYESAYEPGCSIGVLTEKLAPHCEEILACDFSSTAAAVARHRCEHLENVVVRCAPLSAEDVPAGCDLVILSEIGYYFSEEDWVALMRAIVHRLGSHATVLAVHWLGRSNDHRMSGDRVHELLGSIERLRPQLSTRFDSFRLDRWGVE